MNKKLEFFSSMAVAFIVLILVFLCIRFSGQGKFATHGGTNPSDVKCIYTSVWPDNEYTRLICEPESGTIEYILDGSNAGYYAIFYNNISEEEIQKYIEASGFSVVRDFVGHGIGKDLHEDPEVPNFGRPGRGPKLVTGMALAIEPMVNVGSHRVKTLGDDWTVVSADKSLSAHYENTVVILPDGPEILTLIK